VVISWLKRSEGVDCMKCIRKCGRLVVVGAGNVCCWTVGMGLKQQAVFRQRGSNQFERWGEVW